jgi:aldose 1-epimerase
LIELRAGGAGVSVDVERGGRLGSLSIDGRELLVGPPDADDRSIRWGCFVMAPWAGRLAAGQLEWAGQTIQLPRTHGRHAIHGLTWDRPWTVEACDRVSATIGCDLPVETWLPGGRVRQVVRLEPHRLVLEAEVMAGVGAAIAPMPAALGWHPWFVGTGEVRLQLDAEATLATRGMLPTGRLAPVAGRTDLRAGPVLGRRRLDHAYVNAGSPIELVWPDLRLGISFEPSPATVVVHTPPGRVCVEPQTAWPNALGRPGDDGGSDAGRQAGPRRAGRPRLLAAGERLTSSMTLAWKS